MLGSLTFQTPYPSISPTGVFFAKIHRGIQWTVKQELIEK